MTNLNYDDGLTIESLLKENAQLNMALNYFLMRAPDKPTSWEYTRDQAEELALTTLAELKADQ